MAKLILFAILLQDFLLLNLKASSITSSFRKETNSQAILKLSVPDLAPFEEEDKRNDPLGGLDKTRSEYLRALFSTAFYDESCEKAKSVVYKYLYLCKSCNFYVHPVYYWPGQRVDLPCRISRRQTAYNGQMKSWAVKRTGILQDIGRLQSNLESNPFGSTVLADNLDEDIFADVFSWKGRDKFVFMPAFDPTSDGNIRWKTGKYNTRPRTSFVQRDGMLKILTTEVSAYGLYWCFDQQKRDEPIKFVYYLIPFLPLYEMQHLGLHRTECSPGRGGEADRFAMLDANHRFRFLPQTLWGTDNDFCLPSWGECNKQLNSSNNELIRLKASDDAAYSRTGYDINLKIFVHWSPWSKCNKVDGVRTRSGQCHLGRTDHEVRFDPTFKERLFMSSRDYEWFMPVHSLIDNVQEFRDNGIPLFSGVLWDLLSEGRQPVSQCSIFSFNSRITSKIISDNYKSLWRMVIRPLMDKADPKWHYMGGERFQIGANPCFYWNKTTGSSASATGVLYAYTLIQNQKCT